MAWAGLEPSVQDYEPIRAEIGFPPQRWSAGCSLFADCHHPLGLIGCIARAGYSFQAWSTQENNGFVDACRKRWAMFSRCDDFATSMLALYL